MGCDGLMLTLEESSSHIHLKNKFKKVCSHFQEATVTDS